MTQTAKRRPTEDRMKVTLTGCWAGPDGVARPGTVMDLPKEQADQLLKDRHAREYDDKRDATAPRGLIKATAK